MGWSYSHITLFGPSQEKIVQTLVNRQAVVSPTFLGFTLVAVQPSSHEQQPMSGLGIELSRVLNCVALALSEYDDDVLTYQLIESGRVTDEYNSDPDYFDFAGNHLPPRGPQGGDPIRLCQLLGRPELAKAVEPVLRKQSAGFSAPDRHAELLRVLSMPQFSVGFDYKAVQDRELPPGLNEEDIIFTGKQP
jgi:hypothetical protein